MKFPVATTALVAAALAFVFWQQSQEQATQSDAGHPGSMSSQPFARGDVVDWVADQVPSLCAEATGEAQGSPEHDACIDASRATEPGCRRLAAAEYPSTFTSEREFRDLSTTMMNCMVRQARPLGG